MKEYFLGSYRRSSRCFDVLWNSFWWFVLKVLVNAAVICMNGLSFGGACSVPALSNFNDMIVALLVKIGMFMRSNLIVFVIAELNYA